MEPLTGPLVGLIAFVTAPIPFLASSGALLVAFAALWLVVFAALVRQPARVDAAWRRLRALPLVVQALAWVLFLPVVAAIGIWQLGWPRLARLGAIGTLAAWNLLVFLPAA